MILSSPDGLRHVNPSEVPCPIVALISTNLTQGIQFCGEIDVECYLLRPFYKEEFDQKLKVLVDRKSWIENLYEANDDFYALLELATLASSSLKPKELLYLIVKKISEIIKVTRCSMISIGVENQRFADVVSSFEDPGYQEFADRPPEVSRDKKGAFCKKGGCHQRMRKKIP